MTGWFADDATIPVPLEECLCPGTPHEGGDVIELRAELSVDGGLAVLAEMTGDAKGSVVERLGRAYLRYGIAAWTFVDDAGEAIPVTQERIARLRWTGGLYRVADRAATLYGEAVLAPLAVRGNGSSPNGRSVGSTSRTRPSSPARRKP